MTEQQYILADKNWKKQSRIKRDIEKAKKALEGTKLDNPAARTTIRISVPSDVMASFDIDGDILSPALFLSAYIDNLELKLDQLQLEYKNI